MTHAAEPLEAEIGADERRLAADLFDALRVRGSDGVGITRQSYSADESAALDIVEGRAAALGLTCARDRGGNLVATLAGTAPDLPFVACGSHLDSVPQGGNFDGAAGVVAGLVIAAGLKRRGVRPRRTLKVYGLRGEESARFGRAYMGSSALTGTLSADDLATTDVRSGESLASCMEGVGIDVAPIRRREPLLAVADMAAWIELHIEQGPVLVARDLPVGIVTGIRGNRRHRAVTCHGEAGHSGAVPRWLRRDAVFALSDLVARLDRHWMTLLERGGDAVVTVGMVGTDPQEHAIARIPGKVTFSFEVRSQTGATLDAFYDLFRQECSLIEEERGVHFTLDRCVRSEPAVMDAAWTARLKRAARSLGLNDADIPSGAGHDAAVFAAAGVPSAMVFVRNANGSHNPAEAMDLDDFYAGVAVMSLAIGEALR